MEKAKFNLLIASIAERVEACKYMFNNVQTTADIEQLSLAAVRNLKLFCADEIEKMTKILMVDLYHIIGMGGLTPVQMMKFIYLIKDYCSFRPNIKAVANWGESLFDLPKIPAQTKFKLLALCEMELSVGESTEFENIAEDTASLDEYVQVTTMKNYTYSVDDVFTVEGNKITVKLDMLPEFIKYLNEATKTEGNVTTLLEKIKTNKSYFGITWDSLTETEAVGHCTNHNILTFIMKKAKKI